MSESTVTKIDNTHYVIDGKLIEIPKANGAGSMLSEWLRKGGWTTLAGYIQGLIKFGVALIVYDSSIMDGQNPTIKKIITAAIALSGSASILMGTKAATTQKPQATEDVSTAKVGPRPNPLTITSEVKPQA